MKHSAENDAKFRRAKLYHTDIVGATNSGARTQVLLFWWGVNQDLRSGMKPEVGPSGKNGSRDGHKAMALVMSGGRMRRSRNRSPNWPYQDLSNTNRARAFSAARSFKQLLALGRAALEIQSYFILRQTGQEAASIRHSSNHGDQFNLDQRVVR